MKTYIVACDSTRFKGVTGQFGRVAIPTFEENIEAERAYLQKHYDCKEPIIVTELIKKETYHHNNSSSPLFLKHTD